MAVEKITISLAAELADKVRSVSDGNVSAWLADAAARKLRNLEARQILADHEAEHGEITAEELAEVRQKWPA